MAKARLRMVTPTTVNRTVAPKRPPNKDLRTREHLTETEVERLIKATQDNRYSQRDATMVLLAYRHGLRAAERPPCTSAGSSRARPARIRSSATNCAPSGGCIVSRRRSHPSCSRRSVVLHLLRLASPE
jgi:hypothetical protein